jgi:ubiquinone/menaquinone biosynthesis C-methylase UbiE
MACQDEARAGNILHMDRHGTPPQAEFVAETAFGVWFLQTETWVQHVLRRALDDLLRMMEPGRSYPDVLDVGCGRGKALRLLDEHLRPRRIVGLDPEAGVRTYLERAALQCRSTIEFWCANAADTGLPDRSFDLVFCHQTLHHIVDQKRAVREFYRVLRPGGVLLIAESTRRYIHSLIIRLLFRHPMEVQKTAGEYIELIREAGFLLAPERISFPYLWWSRPDLGLLEKLGFGVPLQREETLVNGVAVRPI